MSDHDETDRSSVEKKDKKNLNINSSNNEIKDTSAEISKPIESASELNDDKAENKKQWVKFDDDENSNTSNIQLSNGSSSPPTHPLTPLADEAPAVLTTETVHINLDNAHKTNNLPKQQTSPSTPKSSEVAVIDITPKNNNVTDNSTAPGLRTIELSSGRIREGFANGDVIVTLLPINTKLPWITPAEFRPELVPEELMAQGLTLTVEEYVHAMETLVNDYRFTLYNICYKRVLVVWIFFAFAVLLTLLFSGLMGITLFCLGVGWLFLNAVAIFFCMYLKLRLSRGLEKCLANVNKQLLRHKIILALDDRGKLSCHKVNLCFIYFDPNQCIAYLNDFIERHEQSGTNIEPGWEARLDISANDIIIQGSSTTRVSRKQERAALLLLRYASRWGNEIVRGLADVTSIEPARHCAPYICICQFIERHLSCKPRDKITKITAKEISVAIVPWP